MGNLLAMPADPIYLTYDRAALDAKVFIQEGNSNGRRDPLDWRIQGPPKLYSPGQGGSGAAGAGIPEPNP